MAEPDVEEDIFADLYEDNDAPPPQPQPASQPVAPEPEPEPMPHVESQAAPTEVVDQSGPLGPGNDGDGEIQTTSQGEGMHGVQNTGGADDYERPIGTKEDGKMFIGGLNWETTDQSLKDYFSQFGEVTECTVMRDGATGRSRGFGFLTFRDPKTVNVVMVKEHQLDGKLIDPKRAIPREEQERTAKIFVGGVSQECTESEFKEFFTNFGRVLDATLMMDKDTGRPRGFGFVTFDSDAAVDRTLEGPLAIHNKMIEVKRAQPRGNLRDDDGPGKFNRGGQQNKGGFGGGGPSGGGNFNQQGPPSMPDNSQNGNPNNMSAAMMAQYWQRMQQYFQMMQQQMAMQQNPAMMQQMMNRQQGGMTPQMMQQMAQMQQQGGGGGGGGGPGDGGYGGGGGGLGDGGYGGGMNNGGGGGGGSSDGGGQRSNNFNAQEQMMFEQQKYERQQMARMQQGNFQGGNTWEGMYDDVPAPSHVRGGYGGQRGGGGVGGAGAGGRSPAPPVAPGNAPANAPTGPKNPGMSGGGGGYRGGGRGGRRGFHPYSRGGG